MHSADERLVDADRANPFEPRIRASTRHALSDSPLAGNGPRSFQNRKFKTVGNGTYPGLWRLCPRHPVQYNGPTA